MVAPGPHGAPPAESAVHGAGDPDGEAADAAQQVIAVVGLDQEMKMIVLCGEMKDPEPAVGGGGESVAHGGEDPAGPEAADGVRGAQCDVDGMRRRVRRARTMGYAGPASRRRLATRAGATAAPGGRGGEGELNVPGHGGSLDWAINYTTYH